MNTRTLVMMAVLISLLLVGAGVATEALAQGPREGEEGDGLGPLAVSSNVIPIQGRLTDAAGHPLAGPYSVTFRLYNASAGGTALCEDTQSLAVADGMFSTAMDHCLNYQIDGTQLWLGIRVGSDAEMTPRQPIYAVPYAWSLLPGAVISTSGFPALHVQSSSSEGRGLRAWATSPTGVNYGVVGRSDSFAGYGGYFYNNHGGTAVWAASLEVVGPADTPDHLHPTLYLVQPNANLDFVVGFTGTAATAARMWRVDGSGKGFFNGGTQTPGADFAEHLAVTGDEADYQPGDVLVISTSADRTVERSAAAYSTAVIGVYSTNPGVLAGAPDNDNPLAGIPVAMIGVAPCKVSAENGPIQRGDLLATSSTPGHAMRAGANPPQGTVLGKALQPLAGGTGTILALVTLQ